jgi:hypothetical protein
MSSVQQLDAVRRYLEQAWRDMISPMFHIYKSYWMLFGGQYVGERFGCVGYEDYDMDEFQEFESLTEAEQIAFALYCQDMELFKEAIRPFDPNTDDSWEYFQEYWSSDNHV